MPTERIRVGTVDEIPEGGGKAIAAGARRIAVFHAGGRFYAVKDVCPHAAAPLHDGPVENGAVTCRNHGYRFDLATGACVNHPECRVSTFPVEMEGGVIYVLV